MKNWHNIFLVILCFILQISFMPHLAIFGVYPNIIFLLILNYLILNREKHAIWALLIGGPLLDLTGVYFFGFFTLLFSFAYLTYTILVKQLFNEPPPIIIIPILITFSLYNCLVQQLVFHQHNLQIIPSYVIYETLVGLLIYLLFHKILKKYKLVKL